MEAQPRKKKRPLTLKQKRFVQKYIELDGNGTQAAIAAGYASGENSAHSIATENLRKPAIIETLAQASARAGLTLHRCAETVAAALDADKPLVVDGAVEKTPDWQSRLRASELGAKFLGALKEGDTTNTMNLICSPDGLAKLVSEYHKQKTLEK